MARRYAVNSSCLRSAMELIVLDDSFPSAASPPRYAEFSFYLEHFPKAEVHTTAREHGFGAQATSELIKAYASVRPDLARRVRTFRPHRRRRACLYYCVFLDVAAFFLRHVERNDGTLVLGLYPGGGFRLDEPSSDTMLRRICRSPAFRKVIATERITSDYLLRRGFCRPDQVLEACGCVLPEVWKEIEGEPRPAKTAGFDIGFAARKYMASGRDKGYDVFVEVAKRLALRPDVRFHVIGDFGPDDIELASLRDRITFHGSLDRRHFLRTLRGLDLLVSPNAPNLLAAGAFDGFPTGCAVEAAQLGVPIFVTDELGLNTRYLPGEELVIITRSPDEIAATIRSYLASPTRLRALGEAGARATRRTLSLERQAAVRADLFREILAERRAAERRRRRTPAER